MDQGREVELKLEAEVAAAEALIQNGGFGDAKVTRLFATYFDTEDGDLRRRGISFRVRQSGDAFIQTIKLDTGSVGLFNREEWEHPVTGSAPDLAKAEEALGEIIPKKKLRAGLKPQFIVDVERSTWLLERDGNRIELTYDSGEVAVGALSDQVSEYELELKSGTPAALFGLAHEMIQVAPLRIGVLAKSDRGYRLLDGTDGEPSKAGPVPLTRGLTTADAFRVVAHACIKHFRLNEPLIASQRSASGLHQARVALRRLRSAISLFRDVVADARLGALRDDLRWISGTLGEARNLDVLLSRHVASRDEADVSQHIRQERERAYDAAIAALDSSRMIQLMVALVEWVELGDWSTRDDAEAIEQLEMPVEEFADQVLDRYRRRIKKRGRNLASQGPEPRHQVRIEAKKLRYASEFFALLYVEKKERRRHKAFLSALEDLQSSLGELNDIATGHELVHTLAAKNVLQPEQSDLLVPNKNEHALLTAAEDAYDRLIDVKAFWR